MNTQAFYTIEEYASLVRIHPHTARQHYRRGLLRGIKIGNAIRIPVSEVERITSLTDPSSGPTTHGA